MATRIKQGFTLLELSLVLLVIGFIITGIFVGQAIKDSAQSRKLISTLQDFQIATVIFKDRYKYLPGDMSAGMASLLFSSDALATGGNENGIYDITPTLVEPIQYFYYLGIAGLYNGASSGTNLTTIVPFQNGPMLLGTSYGIAPFGELGAYNHLGLGVVPNITSYTFAPAFTPEQAYKIDAKMDDGSPNRGVIKARGTTAGTPTSAPSCSTTAKANACTDVCGANNINDTYKLNSGSNSCGLSMRLVIEDYQ